MATTDIASSSNSIPKGSFENVPLADLFNGPITFYSATAPTTDGRTRVFCGLKLNETALQPAYILEPAQKKGKRQPQKHPFNMARPDITSSSTNIPKDSFQNVSLADFLNGPLTFDSTTVPTADGRTRTFCGLKLNETPLRPGRFQNVSFPDLCSGPITFYSEPFPTTDGRTRMFCGLKLNETTLEPGRLGTQKPRHGKPTLQSALNSSGTPVSYYYQGPPAHKCRNCDATMWYEERNNKPKHTRNPSFSMCCQSGKVLLPKLNEPPTLLKNLLDYNDPTGAKFREQIRIYNSMFSFTSFGAKIDHSVNRGRGPYTFRISGQAYHKIGSLLPEEGGRPKYAQLYFYDTQNEVKKRMSAFVGDDSRTTIDETLTRNLIAMLDESSAVAQAFRMARDWSANNTMSDCGLRLLAKVTISRQYNTPNVAEVAALITGDFGHCNSTRDIIVQKKNNTPQRISELHQLYMALQYPLLFPYGETGYHEEIPYHTNSGRRQTTRGHVTMREYYCYRIQQRESEGTTILRGGRLFQQYLVDAYTAVEEQRLKWLRHHQNELRLDLYSNVCDAVTRGDTSATSIGKRIILPSSHTGSPRYMVQNYQDAMALCREYDNPDLFITFTSNPRWPEVDTMISYIDGQKSADRPDIVARVFKMKLDDLMADIMKKQIFGTCQAGIHIIEFQKRGLPHVHMLIWLISAHKCKTPAAIDDVITAEIPSEKDDPEGFRAVTEYMLHGPCGGVHMNAPCIIDRQCSKHFPKPYCTETTIDEEGYANYRRRNNGVRFTKNNTPLDNSSVVPYNRYLLLKYNAHINVEWCNRSRAIKYLFKYLNKGPDRATIVIQENLIPGDESSGDKVIDVDEIKNYLDCRYLSPCEAVWRLFSFDIHYSKPSVIKLSYHLPNQQSITLHDSQKLPALLQRESIKETMFTQWFELNKQDEFARTLTYAKIPTHYVWNQDAKIWSPRKLRTCIGRIVYSNPASGERYYLRMLLNIVKGPRCFEELRTVNGVLHRTFKDACFAYGLVNDDKEWTEAISEAKIWATGSQLRELFVTMLLFCNISKPLQLWESSWEALSDGILHKRRKLFNFPDLILTESQIKNYCLLELQALLNRNGKSLDDYPDLPQPDPSMLTQMDNRLIREELNYNIKEMHLLHENLFRSLNPEQLTIYQRVIDAVTTKKGGLFFLYGPGGTGKTFLYNTVLAKLRSERLIVLAVASSGIASLLLPGGRTAHSRFVIPLELMENSTCGIKQKTHLAALIQEVSLIIWDEAPMTQRHAFEALDKTLRDILGAKDDANRFKLFGGMPILLGGDFRQILPVVTKGKRQEVVHACINRSDLWEHCELHTLSRIMRVNEHTVDGQIDARKCTFNQWVLDIGEGKVPALCKDGEDEPTWIRIPAEFIVKSDKPPIEAIVDTIFPNFISSQEDEDYLRERAILTPRNDDAAEINKHMFKKLQGAKMTFKSSDEICKGSTDNIDQHYSYLVEFLNKLNFPGVPPHKLKLKIGQPVMLLRNLSPSTGMCNGTRLIITDFTKFVLHARIITGSHIGKMVIIPRIVLTSTEKKWPFVMQRIQFPVRPCYAMTINKSQGQSLKLVGLYLPKPVFSHGQLYVALSRVTDPDGLKIVMMDDRNPRLRVNRHNANYIRPVTSFYIRSAPFEQPGKYPPPDHWSHLLMNTTMLQHNAQFMDLPCKFSFYSYVYSCVCVCVRTRLNNWFIYILLCPLHFWIKSLAQCCTFNRLATKPPLLQQKPHPPGPSLQAMAQPNVTHQPLSSSCNARAINLV
ncbi:uncharacterized protein [Rutidosis leptorrhynchoides]|uniref:uncharacterized protein n=1 Tax=Rutidosis leptorrhynchoides TaxID=125765 RepID=UPI003A996678